MDILDCFYIMHYYCTLSRKQLKKSKLKLNLYYF